MYSSGAVYSSDFVLVSGDGTIPGAQVAVSTVQITGSNITTATTILNFASSEFSASSTNGGATANIYVTIPPATQTASYASTLGGVSRSYFENASNLSTGVVPIARLTGSYDITASALGTPDRYRFVYGDSNVGTYNATPADGGIGANNISRSMFYRDNATQFGIMGLHIEHPTSTPGQYSVQIGTTSYSTGSLIYRMRALGTWGQSWKIWTEQNDGAGSLLDADLLDGQQGTYYLDAANLTSVVPIAALTGSYDITASFATFASSSYRANSASYGLSASFATTSSFATFASSSYRANSASFATTASFGTFASSSYIANSASYGLSASYALSASFVTSASVAKSIPFGAITATPTLFSASVQVDTGSTHFISGAIASVSSALITPRFVSASHGMYSSASIFANDFVLLGGSGSGAGVGGGTSTIQITGSNITAISEVLNFGADFSGSSSSGGQIANITLRLSGSYPNVTASFATVASSSYTAISASYAQNATWSTLSGAPDGLVSASTFTTTSQGTVRATINGVNIDVDTGLQTTDTPSFAGLHVQGRVSASMFTGSTGIVLGTIQGGIGTSGVAGLTKRVAIGGTYNSASVTSNVVGVWIGDYDNDGTTVYPYYAEDENNLVDFFIRNRDLTSGSASLGYFGGQVHIGTSTSSLAKNILDLGNATANRGISWGGMANNYANIWTQHSIADLNIAAGLAPSSSVTGTFHSSYGSAMGRALVKLGAFGVNAGNIVFYTSGSFTSPIDATINMPERMRIDALGNVGIGTATPATTLHVQGVISASGYTSSVVNNVGFAGTASYANTAGILINSPTLVSSSTFSSPAQGTVRATINGVNADVDTGLQTGDIPTFAGAIVSGAIQSGVPGSTSAQYLNIRNLGGDFYVGLESSTDGAFFTAASAYAATLYSNTNNIQFIRSGVRRLEVTTSGIDITGSLATSGSASFAGSITAPNYQLSSDVRLKKNIVLISNPLDKIRTIRGVSYTLKTDDVPQVGVIAQEIQQVLPEAVMTDGTGYLTVAYDRIIPLLIEAINAQQAQIEELQRKVNHNGS
jgi:hypothetical protein